MCFVAVAARCGTATENYPAGEELAVGTGGADTRAALGLQGMDHRASGGPFPVGFVLRQKKISKLVSECFFVQVVEERLSLLIEKKSVSLGSDDLDVLVSVPSASPYINHAPFFHFDEVVELWVRTHGTVWLRCSSDFPNQRLLFRCSKRQFLNDHPTLLSA